MSSQRWPKLYPVQHSFSSGEVSPRLLSRSDLEGYASAVSEMTNMRPDAQGPAVRRSGYKFVKALPPTVFDARVAPFYLDEGISPAVIIRDDGVVNIFITGSRDLGDNLLQNPDFQTDLSNWKPLFVGPQSSVTHIAGGGVELEHGHQLGNYALVRQAFTVADDTLEHLVAAVPANPGVGFGTLSLRIGTAEGLSDEIATEIDPNETTVVTWQPPAIGTYWYELSADSLGIRASVDVLNTGVIPLNVVDQEVELAGGPWTGEEVYQIQYAQAPGTLDLYLVHPNHPPWKISYDRLLDSWSMTEVVFTSPPAGWNPTNGYPECITFHQQRLFLGPTAQQPETFWGSKSGVFENFDQGSSADDDALEFTLSRRGRIKWMESAKNFLIGTARASFIVDSDAGVITPSDINVQQQNAYGSKCLQAELLGERVLFVSPDGRKVRSMGYRWTEEQWVATDITFPSEHITINGIKEISFAQDPDNNVLMPTDVGVEVIGITYERSSEIIGFFRDVTDGEVLSLAVCELRGSSLAWHTVRRWSTTGPSRIERVYVEYSPGVAFSDPIFGRPRDLEGYYEDFVSGIAFMDSFIREDGLPRTKIVVGDHLAGRTVQVVGDGARMLDRVVDASGEIDVEFEVTTAYVGLPYTSRMLTLPLEVGAVVARGSGASLYKRYNKILLRLYRSVLPKINGEQIADRHPSTPMDTPEPLYTGFVEVTNLGFDREARVLIETDLPFPLEVLGLYGHFGQDDL